MGAEAALAQKRIALPSATVPRANFITSVRSGSLLFVAGHGPVRDGTVPVLGKLGQDLTVEDGYKVARSVGLNVLATVKAAVGTSTTCAGWS